MHTEALSGGVLEFDEAVRRGACPFLNQLGEMALGDMRTVYEEVEAGNFEALGELAEQLASAAEQKQTTQAPDSHEKTDTANDLATNINGQLVTKPESTTITIRELALRPVTELNTAKAVNSELEEPLILQMQFDAIQKVTDPAVQIDAIHAASVTEDVLNDEQIITQNEEVARANGSPKFVDPVFLSEQADVLIRPQAFESAAAKQPDQNSLLPNDYEVARTDTIFQIAELEDERQTTPISFKAEAYINEQLEVSFDPDTYEVHKVLQGIITVDGAPPFNPEPSRSEDTDAHETIVEDRQGELVTDANEFEIFLAEQPSAELPITLAAIQEKSNEQPLEQTLAQLAELLSEFGNEPEYTELAKDVQDITDVLPACFITLEDTHEQRVEITPGMTSKLLTLLRFLGYEEPGETLVAMTRKYGLAFLMQALGYLNQLKHAENRQEFTTTVISSVSPDEDNLRLRMGKAIFGLITHSIPV